MKNKKKAIIGIVIALVVIGIGGALVGGDTGTSEDPAAKVEVKEKKAEKKDEPYVIEDVEGSVGDYDMSYVITGKLVNKSGKKLSYASVTYHLYDADGNKIGDAYANTSGLEKDGTWKFKAVGFMDDAKPSDVASYKLVEVGGF